MKLCSLPSCGRLAARAGNQAERLMDREFGEMCGIHRNRFIAEIVLDAVRHREGDAMDLWTTFVEEQETRLQERFALPLQAPIRNQRASA